LDFAIELENLTKIFPGRREIRALDDISFKIKRKTAVGYLGPNGAGKTTTIKILTNILKPTAGVARIYDNDIQKDPMKALQVCGTILEVPEFYPYLTPRETMIYLGKIRGMNQQYITRRIKEVMEEVEMSEWVDEKIGKFSTGMKQRTAIAQAMLHEPPLLILDEPTNGLDPKAMAHIRSLIKKLKMDRTVFLSSHLLNEVEQIVDAVILINRGKILAFDDLTKIQQMLKATQIQVNFLEAIDESTIKKINNLNEVQKLLQDNNSLLLSYNGTKKSAAAILDFLVKDLNLKVTTFHPLEKGLEDFYIELIDKDDFQKGGKSFES
jgi:ABC-2 type transport system ATP-binding protein